VVSAERRPAPHPIPRLEIWRETYPTVISVDSLKRNFTVALALGVGVYLTLALVSGIDDLRQVLAHFDWILVPEALGLVGTSYILRYGRWSYFLRYLGIYLERRVDVTIFVAGLAMTVSPGKFGEVLKSVLILKVSGDPISKTAPAVIAERVTDGIGMAAWGLLGALAFGFGPGVPVAFLGITAAGVLMLRSERLSRSFAKLLERIPKVRLLAPRVADFQGASNQLLSAAPMAVGGGLSFVIWSLEISAVYLIVQGVGDTVPFMKVAFIFAVSSIVGLVSMLPGGIGATEATLTGMFRVTAGLAKGPAAAATLITRLVTLWFAAFLGILGLMAMRRLTPKPKE